MINLLGCTVSYQEVPNLGKFGHIAKNDTLFPTLDSPGRKTVRPINLNTVSNVAQNDFFTFISTSTL